MHVREAETKQEKQKSDRKLLSVIGVILCVVFGFMLICNLTIIVKGSLYPERPPSVLGVTPMVVLSGSMSGNAEDHIEVGDLIFVDEADPDDLEVGDVIAFMDGKVVVTHRVIEIEPAEDGGRQFITKGDANNAADLDPVTEDRLVGIYKSRIPKVGDFALFLQKPLGMVLFIGIPALAFVIHDLIARRKQSARADKRTAELEAELERLRREAAQREQ